MTKPSKTHPYADEIVMQLTDAPGEPWTWRERGDLQPVEG